MGFAVDENHNTDSAYMTMELCANVFGEEFSLRAMSEKNGDDRPMIRRLFLQTATDDAKILE